jgi:MFS family permease
MTKQPFYGWKNAFLLSFIYLATSGMVFYAFSVIFPFMLKETGWNRGDASIAITIATLAGGFLIPFAAKLLNKYGSRKLIIIGLAISVVNLLLLGTVVTKLWHWFVIWGVMLPVGRMLSGLLPSQLNIMFWFNRKRATAMGLLMTGAPIGGALAPPIFTWFVGHMGGSRYGWYLSAGVTFLALIASYWVVSKPSDLGQYPDGIAPGTVLPGEEVGKKVAARTYRTDEVWALREVLRTRTFWLLTMANMAQGFTLGIVVNHGVLHLTDIGISKMAAAMVLSAVTISSAFVRFPIGFLGDRVEPRWIYFGALMLMLIGFVGIWKAPAIPLLMVLGAVYGIAYGSILTIGPTLLGNYYGPEAFPNIRGFIGPFLTLFAAGVPTIAGYAVEREGSYNSVFFWLTLILMVGVVCSAFLTPPQKKTA